MHHAASRRVRALLALLLPVAVAIGGCANGTAVGSHGGVTVTGSTNLSDGQIAEATRIWGERYDKDPKDRVAILNYAAALRLNGQADQAVAVMRKGVLAHPKDQEVAAAYGKALAANGEFESALRVIRDSQSADRPDWKLLSAEGAILDQMGKTDEARALYEKARLIAPDEPSILNNLALSHLLAGDLAPAETLLRQASASPKANSRIRQNLALVIGLQGRWQEAEQVASAELDPTQAAANVAYLKSMMAQANTWNQIKAQDKKKA